MITAIHLENFKAYGKRTTIPIRPLTFLCGPNNGGKSSITQAIAIAAEILNEGHFDGHRLKLDGGQRDFGGMSMLRHERNPEVNPRVSFSMQLDGELPVDHYDLEARSREIVQSIADRIDRVEVSIDMDTQEIEVTLDGLETSRFVQATGHSVGSLQLVVGRWPDALIPGEDESERIENTERMLARWFFHQTDPGIRLRDRIVSKDAWAWSDSPVEPWGLVAWTRREASLEIELLNDALVEWDAIATTLSVGPAMFREQLVRRGTRLEDFVSEAHREIGRRIGSPDSFEWVDFQMDPDTGEVLQSDEDLPSRTKEDYESEPIDTGDLDGLPDALEEVYDRCFDSMDEPEWMEVDTQLGLLDELMQAAKFPAIGESREPVAMPVSRTIRLDRSFELPRDLLSDFASEMVSGSESRRILEAVIDLITFGPCRLLRERIGEGISLGPIRSIANSRIPRRRDASWYDGSRGWAELLWGYRAPSEPSISGEEIQDRQNILFQRVNEYLAPSFLDMGLVLDRQYRWDRPVDEGGEMGGVELPMSDEWDSSFGDILHADEHYESSVHAVVLKSLGDGKTLQTTVGGVGAGFSQVVPCLIALHQGRGRSVSLEQPELHLNPRQMVALGDVLLHAVFAIAPLDSGDVGFEPTLTDSTVLVETHSEEVILRVMRRIRERHKAGKNVPKDTTEDQIIVVYVDQASETFRDRPAIMRIGSDGKWMSPWPDDFFRLSSMERVR